MFIRVLCHVIRYTCTSLAVIGRCILIQLVIGWVICIRRQYLFDHWMLYEDIVLRMRVVLGYAEAYDLVHLTADISLIHISVIIYSFHTFKL